VTKRVTIATIASTDNAILAMDSVVKSVYSLVAVESCRSWEGIIYIYVVRISNMLIIRTRPNHSGHQG
jgi:hypothetical protein